MNEKPNENKNEVKSIDDLLENPFDMKRRSPLRLSLSRNLFSI